MKAYKSATIKLEVSTETMVSQLYKFLTNVQEYEPRAACVNIAYHNNLSYSKVAEIIGL